MTESAAMTKLAASEDQARLDDILATYHTIRGALLPILHAVQKEFGYIPEDTLPVIADALNTTLAEIHGVVSFYHDFRKKPAGSHVIKLCRAEACQAMGGTQLAKEIQSYFDIGWGETTPDGSVTLEPVFCLGLCACAPAAMVDGQLAAKVTLQSITSLLKEA